MGTFKMDQSENQIVEFKQLILWILQDCRISAAMGNSAAYHENVNQLDIMMEPYKDPKYYEQLDEVEQLDTNKAQTPNELKRIEQINERNYINEKQRALIKLAYRKGFLPSASTGRGGI